MSRPVNAFALAAIGGAVFLLAKNSDAQAFTDVEAQDTSNVPDASDNNAENTAPQNTTAANMPQYSIGQKIAAFLYMVMACEHLYPTDVTNGAAYNLAYGQQWFNDMSDHPANTGDMELVYLSDAVCSAAGLSPGCHTSAAGAYQILQTTWNKKREAYGITDFSRESQDAFAFNMLNDAGVVAELSANNFAAALQKASKLWASLPGSTAQQNPKKFQFALDRFNEGLASMQPISIVPEII